MENESVREILIRTFVEIKKEHGIALESVEFELIDTSTFSEVDYIAKDVKIEGRSV